MNGAVDAGLSPQEFESLYELEQYQAKQKREWVPPPRKPAPKPVARAPEPQPLRLRHDDLKSSDGFWKTYQIMVPSETTDNDLLNPVCWADLYNQLEFGADIIAKTQDLSRKWNLEVTRKDIKPKISVRIVSSETREATAPAETKAPRGYLIVSAGHERFNLVKRVDSVEVVVAGPFPKWNEAFSYALNLPVVECQ